MDKLQAYLKNELDALRAKGVFHLPRVLETEQKATVVIDGHEVITLSSNNYLGLTVHPRMREAAIKAIEQYGVGSGSVRRNLYQPNQATAMPSSTSTSSALRILCFNFDFIIAS